MNKRTRQLFAAALVLSLAIPVSAYADETTDPAHGNYDYVDEPFNRYLKELHAELKENEHQQEMLQDLLKRIEADEITVDVDREQLYQWLRNILPGFERQ